MDGWSRGQRMYRGACVTHQWSVEKCSQGEKVLINNWIIAGFQVWNVSVRQKWIKGRRQRVPTAWNGRLRSSGNRWKWKWWVIVQCVRRTEVENRPAKVKDEAGEVMSLSMRSQWGETHACRRKEVLYRVLHPLSPFHCVDSRESTQYLAGGIKHLLTRRAIYRSAM